MKTTEKILKNMLANSKQKYEKILRLSPDEDLRLEFVLGGYVNVVSCHVDTSRHVIFTGKKAEVYAFFKGLEVCLEAKFRSLMKGNT